MIGLKPTKKTPLVNNLQQYLTKDAIVELINLIIHVKIIIQTNINFESTGCEDAVDMDEDMDEQLTELQSNFKPIKQCK